MTGRGWVMQDSLGACPQTLGIYRFFQPEWMLFNPEGQVDLPPRPFRPLSRSLGLLPSIALSRPTQVGSV